MLTFALILLALLLVALGAQGLYNADPDSPNDFIVAGLELGAAIALAGVALVLWRRKVPDAGDPAENGTDREEVIERLQRHTEALRLSEAGGNTTAPLPTQTAVPPDTARARARTAPVEALAQRETADPSFEPTRGDRTAPSEAVRLPPLMMLNVPGTATAADIETAPPLGNKDDVLARLRDIVPDLEIDARGRSEHTGPDHEIRLDLGTHDPVHTIVIEAGGRTGVSLVRWLLESTGWRAFVPRLGRFVGPDDLDEVAARIEG